MNIAQAGESAQEKFDRAMSYAKSGQYVDARTLLDSALFDINMARQAVRSAIRNVEQESV